MKTVASLHPPMLDKVNHQELLDYFVNTWELYEWLFSSIKDDASLYIAPDPLRHPLIFYLGHTAAFYINKLVMAGIIQERINPHFEVLFEQGVDPEKEDDLETSFSWPEASEVREYRKKVFDLVLNLIPQLELKLPIRDNSPLWAIMMGLEHDRIHFETSSMLIRQYEEGLVQRPDNWEYAPSLGQPPKNEMIALTGSTYRLGKGFNCQVFGWDNEFGNLSGVVRPFAASKNLISNAEFIEFIKAGGYQEEGYWTQEGWQWREEHAFTHPLFWIPEGDGFRYRAMFDEMDLPMDWPAEVNCHEAMAYCRWKGPEYRLLTEAEFARISSKASLVNEDCVFADSLYNLNLKYGSPSPVGMEPKGQTSEGFNDIFGNVWDWLSDDFYALPGYEPHYLYEDFSAPYIDEKHSMLLGGAWASSGSSASKWYRLWFRRHFFQHAGFRLAKSLN